MKEFRENGVRLTFPRVRNQFEKVTSGHSGDEETFSNSKREKKKKKIFFFFLLLRRILQTKGKDIQETCLIMWRSDNWSPVTNLLKGKSKEDSLQRSRRLKIKYLLTFSLRIFWPFAPKFLSLTFRPTKCVTNSLCFSLRKPASCPFSRARPTKLWLYIRPFNGVNYFSDFFFFICLVFAINFFSKIINNNNQN